MITLDPISKHKHTSKESRQTGAKDTKATRINKGFQKCRWNVKVETPMYANTKFSIRKFSSSNNWNRDSRLLFQLTSDRPTIQTHSVQYHKLACLSKPTYQLTSTSQHVSPARVNAEACIMYLSNALPQRQTCVVLCYTGCLSHRQQCTSTASAWPFMDWSTRCVCVLRYLYPQNQTTHPCYKQSLWDPRETGVCRAREKEGYWIS